MAKAPKERDTTLKTGMKEDCEKLHGRIHPRAGNLVAAGGGGGRNAVSLRLEPSE